MIAIVGSQAAAPAYFPKPRGGGINWDQTLWAGVAAAMGAAIGTAVGKVIVALGK